MTKPIVLELASLPREQVGPFLLLGLSKEATKEQIEEHWADRLKWVRRNLVKVPLEDINWARDVLTENDKRIRADAASLNTDTAEGLLAKLARRYGGKQDQLWQPLDIEKSLADYSPQAEVPDVEAVRAAVPVVEIPQELPAVPGLLERLAAVPLDPWAIELPPGGEVVSPLPHGEVVHE